MGVCSSQNRKHKYNEQHQHQLQPVEASRQFNISEQYVNQEQNEICQKQEENGIQQNNIHISHQNKPQEKKSSIIYQQNQIISARQTSIDQVCNKCQKHVSKEQQVQIKQCKHIFDIYCFINHFKVNNRCCSDQKIALNKQDYPKEQVNEIMKHQLNQLITNIQDKMIVVQCPTQYCSFLFFYSKIINKGQTKKFYCHRCELIMVYDQKMCKFIEQQTVLNNQNDALIYKKLEIETYECKIQEHLRTTNVEIELPCSHKWCKKCLFINYKDCLKAICHCGQHYPTSIVKDICQEQEWINIYERQLEIIMNESKLSWQFCKNKCGFFFQIDNKIDDFYCLKCDEIKICEKCKIEVLSQYITMNKCNHYYHLLCSYDLLKDNKLKDMSCLCHVKIDDQTKYEMNIICIQCQKYDDELIMLQCCHFIHKECLENNLQSFSSLQCTICHCSINNILNEPKLLSIKDKLLEMEQININNNYCKHCANPINKPSNCQMHYQGSSFQYKYDDYKDELVRSNLIYILSI